MMAALRNARRWFRRESGSSTVEICIWMPFVMMFLGSAIELGLISTRQALLASGVDKAFRDLTLGNLGASPSHDDLRNVICNYTGVIPTCDTALKIELERIDTATFAVNTGQVQCIDRVDSIVPVTTVSPGNDNDLMLATICAAIQPMFPIWGLGYYLPKINNSGNQRAPSEGEYGLVAFSAIVVEPQGS